MKAKLLLAVVLGGGLVSGCVSAKHAYAPQAAEPSLNIAAGGEKTDVMQDRMLIWRAGFSIEVADISNAVVQVSSLVEQYGGFIEQNSDQGDGTARLTLRVPVKSFKAALSSFDGLGKVTYRNIEGQDVTEQYVDIEARLKNRIVLRDRLHQLLEKAVDVKDILAIETELNRVQSDIDSMEARMKSLKGQVEYATIRLSLNRKPIPGPLGYLFKSIAWGLEKLFVIRR